jgi:hypothetical protein
MILASVDIGLMSNHLPKHEAIINKLKNYQTMTGNTILHRILAEQIKMMQNHVKAMLHLMNPNQSGPVMLPPVTPIPITVQEEIFRNSILKDIAIEGRGTAQFMATDNLVSAMEMKVPAVKNAHINMAWQQTQIADFYNELISQIGWEHPPAASAQEQLLMIQQFQHIAQEQPSLHKV